MRRSPWRCRYSFLTLGWHYPSDVLGGFLVAGVWTLLGMAALSATERAGKRSATTVRLPLRQALRPIAFTMVGALILAGLVAITRPHAVVVYAEAHRAFMLGAAAIAVLGLMIATGVMLALRPGLSGTSRAPTTAPRRGLPHG